MFQIAQPYLLALAIGLLVGIERERSKADTPNHAPLGSRTFTLLALLGALAGALESTVLVGVTAGFAAAIVLAGYFRTRLGPEGSGVGATTEVAAMVTFVLGTMTHDRALLAAMLAVLMTVVLALKTRIHEFARAGVSEAELSAVLILAVLALVVLPLLPEHAVDPWGVIQPRSLWLVLVLLAVIQFGGYVLVRAFGAAWGLPLAGFTAGLVSSTAATLALSRKSREAEGIETPAAAGIVLANTASVLAQALIVIVVAPEMLRAALPVLGAAAVVGFLTSAAAVYLAHRNGDRAGEMILTNPLALRSTALFASLLALVLVVMTVASRVFGSAGVLVTAAVGGTTDVHAVTLSLANLASTGELAFRTGTLGILVAFLSNMVVKLSLTLVAGDRRLALRVVVPLVAMMAAAAAAYLAWPR